MYIREKDMDDVAQQNIIANRIPFSCSVLFVHILLLFLTQCKISSLIQASDNLNYTNFCRMHLARKWCRKVVAEKIVCLTFKRKVVVNCYLSKT